MGEAVSQGRNCFNYHIWGATLDLARCPLSLNLREVETGGFRASLD